MLPFGGLLDQVDERVKCLGREHRIGADVRVVGAGFVVDLEQRRHGNDCRRYLTCETLRLQLLGESQRQIAACRVTGQHNLVRVVALQAQPLVGVVAVVERHPDGVLRDHSVVNDEHRAVGVLRQCGHQPAVRVGAARQKRPTVHVEDDAVGAVGGKHATGPDKLRAAVWQRNGGAHGARSGPHDARDEVHQTPRPRQSWRIAADC